MPPIPTSTLVTQLEVPSDTSPPDVIVVRGYVGPADPLEYANQLLRAANKPPMGPSADLATLLGGNKAPQRIYLTARLDCWIEVDDWRASAVRWVSETNTDRLDAWTVWLRARTEDGVAIRYRVVTSDVLDEEDGFVSGRLVEDYMSRGDSGNVVWDEQQFGPTTGKSSTKRCF